MKPIGRRFIRLLPLDARGRRVVDQVLADWRFEAAANRSRSARLWTHATYVAAFTEALITCAVRSTIRAPIPGLAATSFLYLLLFYAMAVAVPSSVSGLVRHLPADTWLPLLILLFASYTASFLPVAAFLSALRSSVRNWRRRDWLVASAGGLVGLVAFIGWILPDLNQAFRVLALRAAGQTGDIVRGSAELTFSELLADGSPHALASLAGRLGVAVTFPIALFIASRVTSWSGRRRAAVGVMSLAATVLLAYSVANLLPVHLRAFLFPAVALAVVLLLTPGSRQHPGGTQTIAA